MRPSDCWRSHHFWRGVATGVVLSTIFPWWAITLAAAPIVIVFYEIDLYFDLRDEYLNLRDKIYQHQLPEPDPKFPQACVLLKGEDYERY